MIIVKDENIYNIVAKNIKKNRKEKGWTQIKLAMESNISVDYLKKIETKSGSTKQFSLDTVEKIANALNIKVKDLFEEIDK